MSATRSDGDGSNEPGGRLPVWLDPGALVVMQPHGVGEVLGLERRIDAQGGLRQYAGVRFQSGVQVLFPVEEAAAHLRPVISADEARDTLEKLCARALDSAGVAAPSEVRRASHGLAALKLQSLYVDGAEHDPAKVKLVETLEALVLGEIAAVLDRPLGEVRHAARDGAG